MQVLVRLAYLLALLGAGAGARYAGALTERRTERLTDVAFYVALPALVFGSTYDRSLAELVSPALVGGVLFVIGTTSVLAWLVHRRNPSSDRRSVAVVQSFHSNLGFLGLPLVAATMGEVATGTASVVLGIGALVQSPLTIGWLVAINDADASVGEELRSLATNPVLAALVAGLAASQTSLTLPGAVDAGLGAVSTLALPIALLCVGASIRPANFEFDVELTGTVVAMKVGLMPVLAWGVFTLLGVGRTAALTVVIMLAMPSAVATYVYANELGGDAQLASVNVFASTVVSLPLVALVLQVA